MPDAPVAQWICMRRAAAHKRCGRNACLEVPGRLSCTIEATNRSAVAWTKLRILAAELLDRVPWGDIVAPPRDLELVHVPQCVMLRADYCPGSENIAIYSHGAALRNPRVKKNGKDFDPKTLRNG